MKSVPLFFVLVILACCGSETEKAGRAQNSIYVKFTDINGNIFDSNEKHGEYLLVNASDELLILERVQVDGSRSRFHFKGDIISQHKDNGKQVYWAKSHHSEDTYKYTLFGVNPVNNTIDSIYEDYGEDYHVPQARLLKFYGDLRCNENRRTTREN